MVKDAQGKQQIITVPIDQVNKLQKQQVKTPVRQPVQAAPVAVTRRPTTTPEKENDSFFVGNEEDPSVKVRVRIILLFEKVYQNRFYYCAPSVLCTEQES